jgi:hypothetical protein
MNAASLFLVASSLLPHKGVIRVLPDSVINDSIYKLAVNPADYPKDAYAFLLDEGVYRIEANGRWSRTLRQVIQILKPQGADMYREQQFAYEPDREKLTINWMRVVRPNGEVISGKPEQVQESDVPAAMAVPTYTSTKVKRLSLSGLDSGSVLDVSVTTEEINPPMPGDFLHSWRINPPTPVRRSLMVLDVPQSYNPTIVEKNLNFRRTERVGNGRKIYVWAVNDMKRQEMEPFAPDTAVKDMRVSVSAPITWSSVGNWYAPIVAPKYAITPSVTAKIKSIVAGAKTQADSIAAIQKWVSTDVRYVAIELGRGGYEPRDAETVTRTGFGDCKDKTMLFLAALRSMGITGYPVLLNAIGRVDETSPAVEAFDHVIAAVQTKSGLRYSDLTVPDSRFGELPTFENGKFGVIVKDGASEPLHLPEHPAKPRTEDVRIVGKLAADGSFSGNVEERVTADGASFLRAMLLHPPDSATRSRMARSLAGVLFEGAEGDSLSFLMAPDSSAILIRAHVTSPRAASQVANLELLTNPIHPFQTPTRYLPVLQKAPTRKLPFDLAKLSAGVTSHDDAFITLPDGWRAILPKDVSYSGLLGTLQFSFAQQGNELRISRTSTGAKGVVGPEKLAEIIDALKQLDTESVRLIPIQKQ